MIVVERAALGVEEAVRYLGVARATLYRLMDSGTIRSFHIGRRHLLLKAELDRYIAQQVKAEDDRSNEAGPEASRAGEGVGQAKAADA